MFFCRKYGFFPGGKAAPSFRRSGKSRHFMTISAVFCCFSRRNCLISVRYRAILPRFESGGKDPREERRLPQVVKPRQRRNFKKEKGCFRRRGKMLYFERKKSLPSSAASKVCRISVVSPGGWSGESVRFVAGCPVRSFGESMPVHGNLTDAGRRSIGGVKCPPQAEENV